MLKHIKFFTEPDALLVAQPTVSELRL